MNFRADELACRRTLKFKGCLRAKGYTHITQGEFVKILEKELAPVDIVARNVSTGHFYAGKAKRAPNGQSSSIEMTGLTSSQVCTGYSEITKLVTSGTGSLGKAELLCRDGRKIVADFVYQTLRSGYGRGIDTVKNVYQFMFGDFGIDPESLKKQFDAFFEKLKQALYQAGQPDRKTAARFCSFSASRSGGRLPAALGCINDAVGMYVKFERWWMSS